MAKGSRNAAAFEELLKGPEVQKELKRLTARAASAAGPGFESEVSVGRGRALGMVYPATSRAIRAEAKEHRLMRSQDAMREGS